MSMMPGQTHIKYTFKVSLFWDVTHRSYFGTTYGSHHQGSGNVSGILLGHLDPGRWDSKFVPKRRKLTTKVLCVHIPQERRSHSHRGGSPQSRSNIFVDMNNKAAFNLGNRRCLYDRPTWTGGRCPTVPLLRHTVLAVVLVKRFPLAKRQNTELASIPLRSDYDN